MPKNTASDLNLYLIRLLRRKITKAPLRIFIQGAARSYRITDSGRYKNITLIRRYALRRIIHFMLKREIGYICYHSYISFFRSVAPAKDDTL